MARTAQTAPKNAPRVFWVLDQFPDHNGKLATLVQKQSASRVQHEQQGEPCATIRFQIYLALPESAGNESSTGNTAVLRLLGYLEQGFDSSEPSREWEVYWTTGRDASGVLACVEHQRREIAHRKRQTTRSAAARPLIPKIAFSPDDERRCGFFIWAALEDLQPCPDRDEPVGPLLWVRFDRRFPARARAEELYRLECPPELFGPADLDEDEDEEENLVLPERVDIAVERVALRKEGSTGNDLLMMAWKSKLPDETYDLAVDEDEGQPQDNDMEYDKIEPLIQGGAEAANADSDELVDITFGEEIGEFVAVFRSQLEVSPSDANLVYLVYPKFLTHVSADRRAQALGTTARSFTAALTQKLPSGKTAYIEFRTPMHDASLGELIARHRALLAARPGFSIGVVRPGPASDDGSARRIHPCYQYEQTPANAQIDPFRTFLVVLDKPDFVQNQGVLLVMTDGGRVENLPWANDEGEEVPYPYPVPRAEPDYDETLVLRSGGMAEVARRLGMLVLDADPLPSYYTPK